MQSRELVPWTGIKDVIHLKVSKRDVVECLKEGKGKRELYNYILISNIKETNKMKDEHKVSKMNSTLKSFRI